MISSRLSLLHSLHHHHRRSLVGAIRSVFIQTTETPNPESLKFIPTGQTVLVSPAHNPTAGYSVTKQDADLPATPRLARQLLELDGIKAVYLGGDFVTVTKKARDKWKLLRPAILNVMMNWAELGKPIPWPSAAAAAAKVGAVEDEDDDEVIAMIKELMEARIRPAVQEDGGDIQFESFAEDTGIVTVRLEGSCVGCPSSTVTLKQGVENMLMHYIPEVSAVEAVEEEDNDDDQEEGEAPKSKSYEERLATAGIPFSD